MIYWHPMVILRRELPMMQKIKKDEKWYQSEKKGYDVGDQDPEVESCVCDIIQKVGAVMRDEAEKLLCQVTHIEYRLVKHKKQQDEKTLMVHRVFCEEDGSVCGVCAYPYVPHGNDIEEMAKQLSIMSEALSAPILLEEDFPFADWSQSKDLLPWI